MHIILVVLHILLQRIVRRNRNRSDIFNNFVITRQISTTKFLRELRKVKFIWLTIEFNRDFTFCRGINPTDVRVIKLVVRPLLRGGIEERVNIDTVLGGLPRFRTLFVLEVKTYSYFLLLRVSGLSKGLPGCGLQSCQLLTCVSVRSRLQVVRWWIVY